MKWHFIWNYIHDFAYLTRRCAREGTSTTVGATTFREVPNIIYNDLVKLLKPKHMEVCGKFAPRGGISIDPFVNGGTGAKYKALAAKRFADWQGVREF